MALFDEVKDECGITWSDDDTDRKVNNMITRAKAKLDYHAGESCNYDADGLDRQLLLTLCRYIWNKSYEEFSMNCSDDLVDLSRRHANRRAMEAEANDST